jgi:hypothetical protein
MSCFTTQSWQGYSFNRKRNIPKKRILGLVQDGNDKVLGWFWGWQATWERNQGWSLQVSRLLSHRKANPDQNKKEKEMGKIQGVTNLPPLKKSRPRDLVAQGLNINFPTWGNRFQLGFPLYLCILLPLISPIDCLALMWFISLDSHSDRSFLIYYSDFNPFMSNGLPRCNELSWLQYPSFSQARELFFMDVLWWSPIRMIVHWLVNRSSRGTWNLLLIVLGCPQRAVCPPSLKQYCDSYRSPSRMVYWTIFGICTISGITFIPKI